MYYIGQPPRFTSEPQDRLLYPVRNGVSVNGELFCGHDSPGATLRWFRNGNPLTNTGTRTVHDNGTVVFRPLISDVDISPTGIEYHCVVTNEYGSVISRTAILYEASRLI